MGEYLIRMFGSSLILTVLAELGAVFLFRRFTGDWEKGGGREKDMVLLVILINVLTNPPAVLICLTGRLYLPRLPQPAIELVTELAVVMTEGYVYRSFAGKRGWKIGRPFALAVAANACSYGLGLILSAVR